MRTPTRLLALALGSACLSGQEPLAEPGPLLELLSTPVEVAARGLKQKLPDAPAIVSVITGEEIREMGYRSVAEALESVPGFYVINDFLAPNLGVRGVSGGLRAYSRIVKVLIDGQPVSFRSDTTNFLGPELIPMGAVERIEVVRGPASSLYGANAFLGVISIVTRRKDGRSESGGVQVGASFPGGNAMGELLYSLEEARWRMMVAASGEDTDRSGYRLPASSPILLTNPELASVESRGDISRPRSLLLNAQFQASETLALDLLGHFSRLDSRAEFLDFGTLSPENRVAVDNGFLRLKARAELGERLSLSGSVAYADGGPSAQERLNSGSSTSYPRRDVGYTGVDAVLEIQYLARERDSLVVGLDHSSESQQLMTVYTVNSATGFQTAADEIQGHKTFANLGAYAQYVFYPLQGVGFTGNLRSDRHNIYGRNTTYRLGLVLTPRQGLYGKFLYGTSFKAPAAIQLYAQPLFGGDVLGNPELRPESARTLEAEVGWGLGDRFALSLNAFKNKVKDKVELLPAGLNEVPMNSGLQDSGGVEAQAQLRLGTSQTLTGSIAWQKTDAHMPDPFRGEIVAPSAMYPSLTGHLRWHLSLPRNHSLSLVARYCSERRATDSNIRENILHAYALPACTLLDATWSHTWRSRSGGQLHLMGGVRNLLDRQNTEPGFGGVDIPGAKRELRLSFGYEF